MASAFGASRRGATAGFNESLLVSRVGAKLPIFDKY
jgi:hypothetical protein